MSKKPRKQNAGARVKAMKAKMKVRNIAIVYVMGYEDPIYIDLNRQRPVRLTQELYEAFYAYRYKWEVYTAIMLENQLGERYMAINNCSPEHECYKEQIQDTLKESQIKQATKTKKADRVNLGWVGLADGAPLEESEVVALLEIFPDCWTRHERGSVLLDEELTIDQKLQRELEALAVE